MSATDVARVLKVTASAVSNWQRRGTGPLPELAATVNGFPLWRPEQIREIIEDRYADAMSEIDRIENNEPCTCNVKGVHRFGPHLPGCPQKK